MQGDSWLAVRRLACARHPPGSLGSPVLPQGRTERRSADDCAGHTPGSVGSPVLPQGRTEARNRSPFQGGRQSEGRTMQGDCWLAVRRLACARHPPGSVGSPVLPQGRTEERRSADDCAGHTPGSVGSPVLPQGRTEARNRSPFQGGWQSEGRTMQGDCWLAVRRLACVRHTPGSRARPSSLEGGKRWCFCRVRLRHISQVPAVVVIAPIGIQIFVLVMKDCGANVDPMPWSIQTTPATIRRPPTIVDALFTVALGSLFCVRLSRKFFGSVGQFEPAGLSPVEFLDERGKPCSDGRRLVGVSAGRFERFRQIVP